MFPTSRLIRLAESGGLDVVFPVPLDSKQSTILIESLSVGRVNYYLVFLGPPPDLNNKSLAIGAKRGTSVVSDFYSKGFKSIRQTDDYFPLFKMIINGRLDVIAVPHLVYENYVADSDSRLNFQAYFTSDYGFYLKPGMEQSLITLINDSIMACKGSDKLTVPSSRLSSTSSQAALVAN